MQRLFLATVVVLLAMAPAGCGDSGEPEGLALDSQQLQRVVSTGANMTGLRLSDDEWRAIAERACAEGAWDWDTAASIGADLGVDEDRIAAGATPDTAVWLIAMMACPDRFPQDAIDRGPPGVG